MKLGIIAAAMAALALAGCSKSESGNATASPVNAVNQNTANSNANNAGQPVANANANANAAANKPADSGPKRIAFAKGADWGAANVTLAPGATQKFVVGAKAGQTMDVEASSKEVSINLLKGKAETTEDFGFLSAELKANGDFVFEVRNSTKKEIKTSVKVTIEGAKPEDSEEPGDGDAEASDSKPPRN